MKIEGDLNISTYKVLNILKIVVYCRCYVQLLCTVLKTEFGLQFFK